MEVHNLPCPFYMFELFVYRHNQCIGRWVYTKSTVWVHAMPRLPYMHIIPSPRCQRRRRTHFVRSIVPCYFLLDLVPWVQTYWLFRSQIGRKQRFHAGSSMPFPLRSPTCQRESIFPSFNYGLQKVSCLSLSPFFLLFIQQNSHLPRYGSTAAQTAIFPNHQLYDQWQSLTQ